MDILTGLAPILVIVIAWVAIQAFILPRLGVGT